MKANVWDVSGLEVGADLDAEAERIRGRVGEGMGLVGRREGIEGQGRKVGGLLMKEPFKGQWGAMAAMGAGGSVGSADRRIAYEKVEEEGGGRGRRR